MKSRISMAALGWVIAGVAGCAREKPITFQYIEGTAPATLQQGRRIAADPVAFLRETQTRCEQLHAYEVDFYKRERLGLLIRELRDEEHMRVKFRSSPFSVRMAMVNPDHEFAETLYVDGENGGKLRCRRRKSLWPGKSAPVNEYDPALAVAFGKSLNPITDFGVARMMQRVTGTLDKFTEQELAPTIDYLGVTAFEKGGTPAHHVRLVYPVETRLPHPRVDLLFHADSLLPAGSYVRSAKGQLQGQYLYTNFKLDADFRDVDFRLDEPPALQATGPSDRLPAF